MRTTVDIPDDIYRRLKARAAGEKQSATELILRGIERILADDGASRARVSLPLVRSKRPDSVPLDNARIYEVISFP
jgi:hypothetical protein